MFDLIPTQLTGCFEIRSKVFSDHRGQFIKTFHKPWFESHGLHSDFSEGYYSSSVHRTLRGLHLQLPPEDFYKLIFFPAGEVMDVLLDVRKDSPTYGKHEIFELGDKRRSVLYVPPGVAHGFYVKSPTALTVYSVSKVFSAAHDTGVRWDSAGIAWPDQTPIISARDQGLPTFAEFTL